MIRIILYDIKIKWTCNSFITITASTADVYAFKYDYRKPTQNI